MRNLRLTTVRLRLLLEALAGPLGELERRNLIDGKERLIASIEAGDRERELIDRIAAEVSAGRNPARLERELLAELERHPGAAA